MAKKVQNLVSDLLRKSSAFRKFYQADLPRIVGQMAVEDAKKNFEEQSFEGQKWAPRNPETPRNDRPILQDRSNLKDSIAYNIQKDFVIVGVDGGKIPYAEIHQHGGVIQITPAMRKFFWSQWYATEDEFWKGLALTKKSQFVIKPRPYLGMTKRLSENIDHEVTHHLKRILDK